MNGAKKREAVQRLLALIVVVILHIISIFKFLSLVHSSSVLVHSSSASQAHASCQIVSSAGISSGAFPYIPYPHLTSLTTDSGAIAICDRIGTGTLSASHNHPSLNKCGIFGFSTRSWLYIHACMCARSIMLIPRTEVGGILSISPQVGS